jgi:uncharacterized protein (TIGR02246 family)
MKRTACFLIAGGLVAALVIGNLTGRQPGEPAAEAQGGKEKTKEPTKENAADTAAIKQAGQSFIKAYLSGNAKAMAAHWTENGEYYADDGHIIRGREHIEKSYVELFAKRKPYAEASIETTALRFPSKDTAIEEGYFKVRSGKESPTASKFSVLYVREDGKWLMAVVREWPSEGVSIRDLEWLIGTWETNNEDTQVRTVYEWWGDKTFIRVNFMIKHKGKTVQGFQMIGKDRSTGHLRSWAFDPDGGFGEANWTREGQKWMQESAGVLENGSVLAATNILTRIDDNAFTFQSVERTLNGEAIDDIAPVRVTRVKGK